METPENRSMWVLTVDTNKWALEKVEVKHGVRILTNEKWKRKIQWTKYINEQMIAVIFVINKESHFTHAEHADHHVEKKNRTMVRYTQIRRHTAVIAGDFHVVEESNRRGDLLKQKIMIVYSLPRSTRCSKQNTPRGRERRQIDRQKKHESLQRLRDKRCDREAITGP